MGAFVVVSLLLCAYPPTFFLCVVCLFCFCLFCIVCYYLLLWEEFFYLKFCIVFFLWIVFDIELKNMSITRQTEPQQIDRNKSITACFSTNTRFRASLEM